MERRLNKISRGRKLKTNLNKISFKVHKVNDSKFNVSEANEFRKLTKIQHSCLKFQVQVKFKFKFIKKNFFCP